MFTLEVKYIALTVGVLGVAIWGAVGSGWHYAAAMGKGNPIHRERDVALVQATTSAPTHALGVELVASAAAPAAEPVVPAAPAAGMPAVVQEVTQSLGEPAPASPAESAAQVPAEETTDASAAVTVLDDVFYDASRDALVVPYSGATPQTSPVVRMAKGLAYVDFTNARTAFGRPRFKRQEDAGFKSYILNTRPGVDRARLSFVVAQPGELQLEAATGELVVRLTRP